MSIPLNLNEVDTEWLTRALQSSGTLDGARVTSMDARVVGQGAGFMGSVAKLGLTLSPETETPLSLVLKIPTDTDNRHLGEAAGVYEREIRFYQELQPHLRIRTPRHVFSAMDNVGDPEQSLKALKAVNSLPIWLIRLAMPLFSWLGRRSTHRYVLMIENLDGYRVGDQVAGCSMAEGKIALDTMARMHAQFWDGAGLEPYRWLIGMDMVIKLFHMMYLQSVEQFRELHRDWLTERQLAILDWLKLHVFELMACFDRCPDTLAHGDFRLDNLCFDDVRGEAILFDWQTASRSPVGYDLAYFLAGSFAESHPEFINELIDHYHVRLNEEGVDVSRDDVHWQYQAGILTVLHRLVPAQFQDMLDLGEERGADLIDSMLERIFREAEHIDPDALLAAAKQKGQMRS